MPIRLNIDVQAIEREMMQPFVEAIADEKLIQMKALAKANFRNRTGRLFRSIRREGRTGVAIGNNRLNYWQFLKRFRRGNGEDWAKQVVEDGNTEALERAAQRVRARVGG